MADHAAHLRLAHINQYNTISQLKQFDAVKKRKLHIPA
jgi:hypothetical protein